MGRDAPPDLVELELAEDDEEDKREGGHLQSEERRSAERPRGCWTRRHGRSRMEGRERGGLLAGA